MNNNNLLKYYREEISFLREEGKNFASEYPEIAQKIDINNNIMSADPQTERMIESFAFMVAGLRSKIECNTNNISRYISEALYPGLNDVFPSCSIIQFKQNTNTNIINTFRFKRNTKLRVSIDENYEYIISTVYPINIYPIQINKTYINDSLQLNIEISSIQSSNIEEMKIDNLLFYINNKVLEKSLELYNLLFHKDNINIYILVNNKLYNVPNNCIKLCGFGEDETIVPVPKFFNYSFQMIRDLILYPQKFLFFKIINLDKIFTSNNISNINKFTVVFQLDKKIEVDNNCILINAVPAVNLFPCTTEAFRMDGTKNYYKLTPSHPYKNNLEIHSIHSMYLINKNNGEEQEIQKYFNICESNINETSDLYWLHYYNINNKEDEKYISIIDTNINPNKEYLDIVYAKTLCINKISSKYISLSSNIDLIQTENNNNKTNTDIRNIARFITEPSESIHNNIINNDNWKLLQYLAFNKISKSNYTNIKNYLKNIVNLYESQYTKAFLQVIDNITKIETKVYLKRQLINNKHCFIKQSNLIIYYIMNNSNHYYFMFFKVIEKYLQNTNQFNEKFTIQICTNK